jgi:hypothetical protein
MANQKTKAFAYSYLRCSQLVSDLCLKSKRHDSEREMLMQRHKKFLICCSVILLFASYKQLAQTDNENPQTASSSNKVVPQSDGFDYPISKSPTITEAKDKDGWYNAQDFAVNNHLGEDWNKNTGGNTDCGEAVYAAANGLIVFAEDAGEGWGARRNHRTHFERWHTGSDALRSSSVNHKNRR